MPRLLKLNSEDVDNLHKIKILREELHKDALAVKTRLAQSDREIDNYMGWMSREYGIKSNEHISLNIETGEVFVVSDEECKRGECPDEAHRNTKGLLAALGLKK